MTDEGQPQTTSVNRDIHDRMVRLWFETYYDPWMSPEENRSQAKAAVDNGWEPISWPKEMVDQVWWGN